MSRKELLKKALELKPEERFALVEGLIESLDRPDEELDEIWLNEAERRLEAYRKEKVESVPMDDVFSGAQ